MTPREALHVLLRRSRGLVVLGALLMCWMGLGVSEVSPFLGSPHSGYAYSATGEAAEEVSDAGSNVPVAESEVGSPNIFSRSLQGGPIVFMVLMVLLGMSVFCWAVVVSKYIFLRNLTEVNRAFIKTFWESRSLNELNGKLNDLPYSPAREVFRGGYAELIRGSQLREHAHSMELAISVASENILRSITKSKSAERRRAERWLPTLAIVASTAPFIGLFGTVWGIMGAFEGIARTGSASLAAVAPGISEALIATAFGLAAAIPAVIGYNFFQGRLRIMFTTIDGFGLDFLNIVQRYLVTNDKSKAHATNAAAQHAIAPKP
jgi:biopolymer transport protein TolQ